MAEHVWGEVEAQPGSVGVTTEHGTDGLLGEAATETVVEKEGVLRGGIEPEGLVVEQGRKGVPVGYLKKALSSAFAEDADPPLGEIYVVSAEVADLRDSGAGGEESFQDGDVSDDEAVVSKRAGGELLGLVKVVEEAFEVDEGNGSGQALRLLDPDVHLAEGVDGDEVLPLEEVEEWTRRSEIDPPNA